MRFERAYWAVLLLTLIQFCYWMHQFGPHLAMLTDYAARILTGHPDWRALQNRLLGPFILVDLLGWLPASLPIFTALFLALSNSLFFWVAREITRSAIAAIALLAGYILIWLFLIQLANRESALFLAAYLGFSGAFRLVLNDERRLAGGEFAWGVFLFAAGTALIEYVRKKFFIMGPIARAGADLKHRHFENFIIYHKNRVFFWVDLHGGWQMAKGPIFLVFLVALHLLVILAGLYQQRAKVAAYGTAMTLYSAAIFFTAELEETRVMQILVPGAVLTLAWFGTGIGKLLTRGLHSAPE